MKRRRLHKYLTPADEKELGRLVKKYGRPRIAEWVLTVQESRMGRPPAKGMPEADAMAVQLAMGHFEQGGSKSPFIDVARIIYRQENGGRRGHEGWEKWLATFKKRFTRNRKKLMAQLEQDGNV